VDKTTPAAIQISTNYGTTFHSVAGTELFNYHASGISGSGQYMFASNYTTHYFSTDFGNTFNLLTNLPEKYYYSCFTSNYNGQYILLVSDHGNYLSTDYGVTFNVSPYPVGKTAFSDSGEFMVVATANVGVYLSNNYGNTWILSTAPAKNWGDITISADGQRIVVCEYRGNIYISGDFGETWDLYPPAI
jgi:hypothetical protein